MDPIVRPAIHPGPHLLLSEDTLSAQKGQVVLVTHGVHCAIDSLVPLHGGPAETETRERS